VIASRPFPGAGTLTLSAGVGVTGSPADRDALYRLADRALQEAKQQGRDCTCCEVATPARPGPAPVGV
jgi:GGDEF domain-containing protein